MIFLYNLSLHILSIILNLCKFFSSKIQKFLLERELDKIKILHLEFLSDKKVYWLHAASVGELDQSKAIANEILKSEDAIIIQSSFSSSIQERNLSGSKHLIHFRLPIDLPNAYNFIFEKFCPHTLIIVAWDTWPNLILAAKKFNCKVFIACGTLHKKSGRNSIWLRGFTRSILQNLDGIGVVHEQFKIEFQKLTSVNIRVTGDSRFESVIQKIESNSSIDPILDMIQKSQTQGVLILASTYFPCEKTIFPILQPIIEKGFSIWIFPHKIESSRINEVCMGLLEYKIEFDQYTHLSTNQNTFKPVVLFDTIGILAYAYQYANFVYVGGGLHNRVHNVIEPAYFGLPILTGPKINHAAEALILKNLNGLFIFQETSEFYQTFENLISNSDLLQKIQTQNKQYVLSNVGASNRFYNEFLKG